MFRPICIALALAAAPASAQEPAPAPDYTQDSAWLCLPGREDACGRPLPTTALNANGYGSVGQVRADSDAPIDCFYVYPTISRDATMNSDLAPGPEEQAVAAIQAARFAGTCRIHAPMYRQVTLAGLAAVFAGGSRGGDQQLAYGDVLAAWRHYLQHRNGGRPFVLIGHSQGTVHLSRLLAEEIEGSQVAGRMLSALLIGFNVEVPEGQTVGGSFQRTPLCTRMGQTGCVVSYVSFRATNPPPPGALFGRGARPGMTVACTNPAALGSRATAPLDSYWYAGPSITSTQNPVQWSSQGGPPTPFLRTEGLASAACVNRGNVGYLSVTVNADPADARTDRIPGDVILGGALQPGWGLHLADMNLAMGDLIRIVEAQRDAFGRR